ncbi:PadR family transcriptional regulator [Neobacillus niacini]|uniref:PadR family transcriptional regulator n=1 Tax=Neobacillus niacini TaxID=86668 RepID=UPI0021CB356F|nr:PadR family transcriptional regulator [Neobacillus niacini]MCM3765183.1 PadR family transcriptional regulator [Neobacillus niacini]
MEDRLKNLKKSMNRTTFAKLRFTEQHQKQIHERIGKQEHSREEVLLALLQLLVQEKTGFELTKLLRGRGIRAFEDNEGFLYIQLHQLEQSGWIQSNWQEEIKYYRLKEKGLKRLQKAERSQKDKRLVLKELFER